MKFLRRFLDRIHPLFDEGGKLEKLYPLYEGVDSFLYTPGEVTGRASHVRDGMDLKRMMTTVVVALVPCIAMALWNTGYQANLAMQQPGIDVQAAEGCRGSVIGMLGSGYDPSSILSCVIHGAVFFIPVFLVCNIVGLGIEITFACIRGHDVNEGFLVTGMLLPLTLPPTIPLWQVAVATAFGVIIGKEVFGGTGKNFLNPALTARAFLYFAYPAEIVGETVWTAVDGFSGATPLGALAAANVETGMTAITGGGLGQLSVSWNQAFLGTMQGSMGETSTLACLIGAAILIFTGVGSWRIMAGVLIGAMGLSGIMCGIATGADAGTFTNAMFLMPPQWHLVTGGLAFGLVFMATDPVSAAMTQTGKWFYGGLIGVMTILIRVVNPAFPEGVMLAILFGNVFAPTIDYCVLALNIRRRKARNARAA
ncbi:MAG: NADH:ubiquinone reductase (Na(+)-transporting) subunit B [Planctomycetaceae bacterium]|jgi:Na+-transporting NADH:ubiquinone oxidoreductase subunit B|nr:NADH:ubiquinone reductase (Na(+)-transporting) subunit B [Planctomycetaceae bacterium]MBT6483248.1 NADH:ubiquinone reductase (Na(+)-transporting) subunit B [Planctomycetaceae bacterium]MBT6492923.1 NADH:ubiquinone reductase (Na(+)-transporting) subunit B [Planctomycetaceae bacterium]